MPTLYRDYEVHSTQDLTKTGAWIYARHPTTDVWCCAYAVDDGEIKLWTPGDPTPAEFIEAATNPEWRVSAFNDGFERRIEQHIMGPRYGWPTVPLERHICTQAAALAMALPAKLETVAIALGCEHQKDAAGARLMKQMARPRAPRPHEDPNGIYWFDDPERRQGLYQYCKRDVATERDVSQRLPGLIASEQALWVLGVTINDRGIPTDQDLLDAALAAAEIAIDSVQEEFQTLTGGSPRSINQTTQLIAWFSANGCQLEDIQATTLREKLKDPNLSPTARRVIELRLAGAHASVSKLKAMRAWCDTDGRMRDGFRYHGASTGRFTSLGVQLQNLKRPETDDIESAIDAIRAGDLSAYAQPMAIIGDIPRAIIAASSGQRFIAADFSGVESRLTAWSSGQQDKLDQWAKYDLTGDPKDEPYYRIGIDIFNLPPDIARSTGKVGDLAFGFMGSIGAWRALALQDTRTDAEIKALQQRWRSAHPETVRFWRALDRSALSAVQNPGSTFPCKRVAFFMDGDFLKLRLPNGRELAYPFPRIQTNDRGDDVIVFKDNAKGRFVDCRNGQGAYGGLWIENLVQAIARDVFAEAMPALERAGYPIVLHVHDEIVSEVPNGCGSTDEFFRIITTPPAWAEGLPIGAKVRNGPRFSKSSEPATTLAPAEEIDIDTIPPWNEYSADIEQAPLQRHPANDYSGNTARAEKSTSAPPPPLPKPPPHTNGKRGEDYDFSDYQRGEDRSGSTAVRYVYLDHTGTPYLRVHRKANKGGFPQERWARDRWVWGAPPGPPIPYRLPELLAANPEEPVFICEGEKDAENVSALGLIATTNSGGAGKWTSDHCKWLSGRLRVNILADNDEPGRAHASKVAALLSGIVPEIVIVNFSELTPGGDVSDWLEQGCGKADLLERAAAAKENRGPEPIITFADWLNRALPKPDPLLGSWFTTTTRALLWADTGLGKTMVLMAALFRAAAGAEFLQWGAGRPARILYVDGEMSRRLLQERIRAESSRSGLQPSGLHFLSHEDIEGFKPLNTPEGQAQIEHVIARIGGIDGIGFDNVMSLLHGNMTDEEAWQQIMPWVLSLTRRSIGQVWVHHTGHDTSRSYGTKTREWQMDTTIGLKAIERADTDVSFQWSFYKARERRPDTREEFQDMKVALVGDRWEHKPAGRNPGEIRPQAEKFLEALKRAIDCSLLRVLGHGAATQDAWKAECVAMGLIELKAGRPDDSSRSLFSRNKGELIAANRIVCNATNAWLAE